MMYGSWFDVEIIINGVSECRRYPLASHGPGTSWGTNAGSAAIFGHAGWKTTFTQPSFLVLNV